MQAIDNAALDTMRAALPFWDAAAPGSACGSAAASGCSAGSGVDLRRAQRRRNPSSSMTSALIRAAFPCAGAA